VWTIIALAEQGVEVVPEAHVAQVVLLVKAGVAVRAVKETSYTHRMIPVPWERMESQENPAKMGREGLMGLLEKWGKLDSSKFA